MKRRRATSQGSTIRVSAAQGGHEWCCANATMGWAWRKEAGAGLPARRPTNKRLRNGGRLCVVP